MAAPAVQTRVPPHERLFPGVEFVAIPGTKNWMVSVVTLTPEMGLALLDRNTDNRRIRKSAVAKYKTTMVAKNWTLSPEALVFGTNGRMLNGQHRIHAMIQSDTHQKFTVITGVPNDTFQVLDRGANRTPAEALKIEKKLAEISGLMAKSYVSAIGKSTSGVTDAHILRMSELFEHAHNQLLAYCGKQAKVFSSTAVRAAACLRLMTSSDPEYVLKTYRALILLEPNDLSPMAGLFWKHIHNRNGMKTGSSTTQHELMIRSWHVFDVDSQDRRRLNMTADLSMKTLKDIQKTLLDIDEVMNGD